MRPDAGALTTASGVRSPIEKASPAYSPKPSSVVAQSATGTCQGPTIWSREQRPPTVRSPIVIRNVLSATAGARSTRSTASAQVDAVESTAARRRSATSRTRPASSAAACRAAPAGPCPPACCRRAGRAPRGADPSVVSPTTAKGQRSRSQIARKSVERVRARSPARSAPATRCTTPRAASCPAPRSAPRAGRCGRRGPSRARSRAARSTGRRRRRRGSRESGSPAPSAQQRSITSCARRWISALPRCTESKSRSAVFVPVVIDEADPPPMPISMPGPPSWISSAPAGTSPLCACSAWMLPTPPASMIGLW